MCNFTGAGEVDAEAGGADAGRPRLGRSGATRPSCVPIIRSCIAAGRAGGTTTAAGSRGASPDGARIRSTRCRRRSARRTPGRSRSRPTEPGPKRCKVALKYANGTVVSLEQEIINDHQQLGAIFRARTAGIQILRGDFVTDRPELKKGAPDVTKEGPGEDVFHLQNFFECIKHAQEAERRRRDRPPVEHRVPPGEHRARPGPHVALGSEGGEVPGRRRSRTSHARAPAPRTGFELPKIG